MSNKLFFAGVAGAALAATSLASVPASQALPQANVNVGGAVSFGTSIGGSYTGGAGLAVTTPGSAGTSTSGIASNASPTNVGTAVTGETTTSNGLKSKGGADTNVAISPDASTATAGAKAENSGGLGIGNANTGSNTATFSAPGLKVSGGSAGATYGAIQSGF